MLSAIAPRKDSAHSYNEGLKKLPRDHTPHNASPLAQCSTADIVTNDERAKSPDLVRVLSPMRPRRTPKLVNAPDIRWRVPAGLQRMPSLDSILSSNTSVSEASTVRRMPATPHNIALPLSSASSVDTTVLDTTPRDPPLPPSPSPPSSPYLQDHIENIWTSNHPTQRATRLDTRFNEARVSERPRVIPQLGAHKAHLLSPITEVSSMPSIRSSITDFRIEEVGTAQRRPLSDVHRQDVHGVDAAEEAFDARHLSDVGEREERYSRSIKEADGGGDEKRLGLRKVFSKLSKSVKGAARRVVERVAGRCVARVLARVL